MRSVIYRLNKSSLHLAEIGFVDPMFGKNVFQKQVWRKKSVWAGITPSSQSFGLHNSIFSVMANSFF